MRYCLNYPVAICVDRLIQPEVLRKIAPQVKTLFLSVDKEWETIPESYFKLLKNLQIEAVLLVKKEKELGGIRNKYFDISVRPYYTHKESPCQITEKTRFLSALRLIEGGKEYLSYAHWKKGLDKNNKVIDSAEYWRELDHFYIYESD